MRGAHLRKFKISKSERRMGEEIFSLTQDLSSGVLALSGFTGRMTHEWKWWWKWIWKHSRASGGEKHRLSGEWFETDDGQTRMEMRRTGNRKMKENMEKGILTMITPTPPLAERSPEDQSVVDVNVGGPRRVVWWACWQAYCWLKHAETWKLRAQRTCKWNAVGHLCAWCGNGAPGFLRELWRLHCWKRG